MKFSILSEQAMMDLGGALCRATGGEGAVITLSGALGAGKTTLVRGFLRAMGYLGTVKSPTYTLVEAYEDLPGQCVYHFDLYRLNEEQGAQDLENIGAREYFNAQAVCLIEWPQRASGWLSPPDLSFMIEIISTTRQITIQAHTQRGKDVLQRLED